MFAMSNAFIMNAYCATMIEMRIQADSGDA